MADGRFVEMLTLCGTALGLIVLGLCHLLAASPRPAMRLATGAGATAAGAAGPLLLGFPAVALAAAAIVAGTASLSALLGSARVSAGLAAGLRRFGRPSTQAACLSAVGGVVLVAALARYEAAVEAADNDDMAYMAEVSWKPPARVATGVRVTTDAGRSIPVSEAETVRPGPEVTAIERKILVQMPYGERVIRVAPASDVCNCHGWVFTGGRYWLGPQEVQQILADNGYQAVSEPRVGDVVIYRDGDHISHTAVVRTAGTGGPVLVEGKWGWMGVFLHPPDGSCYGKAYTYYRSPRAGHLLAGLGEAPVPPAAGNAPAAVRH